MCVCVRLLSGATITLYSHSEQVEEVRLGGEEYRIIYKHAERAILLDITFTNEGSNVRDRQYKTDSSNK